MISVSCTKCDYGYRVSDDKAGKRFKCRECGEVCVVPAAKKRKRPTSAAPKRRKPRKKPVQDEWDDTAASTDDYESYDEYESHDAYGSSGDEDYDAYEDYQPAQRRRRKPSRAGKSKPKKKRRVSKYDDSESMFCNPLVWLVFPIVATVFTILVFAIFPMCGLAIAVILALRGFGLNLIGSIRLMVDAFREELVCGLLYLFLPFYAFYYLVTRWEQQKSAFLMSLCGSLLIFGFAFTLPAIQAVRNIERQQDQEAVRIQTLHVEPQSTPRVEFTVTAVSGTTFWWDNQSVASGA